MSAQDVLHHLLIALGIGLLIGAERERRKRARPQPGAAGLRTFTIAALLGSISMSLGSVLLLGICLLCAGCFAAISYWPTRNSSDPGITTEFALVTTVLLGGLSIEQPLLSGSAAVMITIMLAAREPLHRFVGQVLSEGELADLLILAGATIVILPLLPDRAMGPFNALNPRALWQVVILILAINAAGHVATRWMGARLGVPLLGLASGFMSSSATIAAMGAWVRGTPAAMPAAAAAGVLSTVATFVQLGLVIGMTDRMTLQAMAWPLAAATATALAAGGLYTVQSWRRAPVASPEISRTIGIAMALTFSAMIGGMLMLVAALGSLLGEPGLLAAAAIGGVLDVHAAAIAVAAQVAAGDLPADRAVLPMLVAWTTSTLAKMLFAATAGPRGFAVRVAAAQAAIIAAAWGASLI